MDLYQEIRSFVPIDIDKYSKNYEVSEKTMDSVKSYNKAIEYLKTGSEDIAMIELKKVVSSNPEFYEALNLLGLCYIYTNQNEKAIEILKRAMNLQGENNTHKASEYLSLIDLPDKDSGKNSRKIKRVKPVKNPINVENKNKKNIPSENLARISRERHLKKPSVTMFISLGVIVCLIVAVVLIYTNGKGSITKIGVGIEPKPKSAITTKKPEKYDAIIVENKDLKEKLNSANEKLNEIKLSEDIIQVSELYGQGKYIEAADKLIALPVEKLDTNLKSKYDSIKDEILLNAAKKLTNDGKKLYDSKKFKEAVEVLGKVFKFGDGWKFGDKALYNLAKSYVEISDLENAAKTYQKLIDEYPNSVYIKYAKPRLRSVQREIERLKTVQVDSIQ